jgi:predicted transcriptional regulator
VDEFVEHAVSMLHEQETWLASHRAEIQSKIEEGYAAAQRGELLEPDEVRSRLSDLKRRKLPDPQRQ